MLTSSPHLIAEATKAEAEIARLERIHSLYSECNRLLLRTRSECNLLNGFSRLIVDVGGYTFAWIGVTTDEDPQRLEPVASAGFGLTALENIKLAWIDHDRQHGPWGRAITEQQVQICDNTKTDPRYLSWRNAANQYGYASFIALPLFLDSRCIGCVTVYARRENAFDRKEVALLADLSHDLAYGIGALRAREDGRQARSQADLFRALLQHTTEMIYVVDLESGGILDANQSTLDRLGYTREELLKLTINDFSLCAAERPWKERVQHIKRVGSLVSEGHYRARNGRQFPVEVSLRYIEHSRAEYLIAVTRDITERQNQLTKIKRLARILRMQSGINSAVLRIQDRDKLLQEACRLATDVGGYDRAVVAIVGQDGRHAIPEYRAGRGADLPEPPVVTIGDGSAPDDSLAGRALRTGKIALNPNLEHPDPPVAMRETIVKLGYKAMVALPLIVEGRAEAVMMLASRDRRLVADQELLVLLQDMMASLSFALRSKKHAEAVQFLATYDSLTGLPRRARFVEGVDDVMSKLTDPSKELAVIAFDIRGLNRINDTYGRHFGDLLLQQVANRVKQYAAKRPIGHLGGGTFVLVEPPVAGGTGGLRSVLDTNLFVDPIVVADRSIPISCHCGVAYHPADGANGSTLVQCAEAALKQAKESGEGYLHYRLEMHSEIVQRLDLEHRLRAALSERQFALYYQAQVDVASNRIDSVEALLRWNDPARGLIPPGEFLPILESTGMIMDVGDWVLEQAAAECARWGALGVAPIRVAVNISGIQLRQKSFPERILDVHRRMEACGGFGLELEITESTLLHDIAGVTRMLGNLRTSGVRIALDDFGTGYSSLSLLSKLPVDVLKLDRSFVAGVPHDCSSMALVENVLRLATALRLTTVVEGVENDEQLAALRAMRCDKWQGYLHGRPMPPEKILSRLQRLR